MVPELKWARRDVSVEPAAVYDSASERVFDTTLPARFKRTANRSPPLKVQLLVQVVVLLTWTPDVTVTARPVSTPVVRLRTVNVSALEPPGLEFNFTHSPVNVPARGMMIDTSSALVLVHVVAVLPAATFMPQNCPSVGDSASVCSVMTSSCGALPPLAVSVALARHPGAWVDFEFATLRFNVSAAAKSTVSTVSSQLVTPPLTTHPKAVLASFLRSVIVCVPYVIAVSQLTMRLLTRPPVGNENSAFASFEIA